MHMNELIYSTNNNIYISAIYAKIVVVGGRYLIWKPSLVTSLCVVILYTKDDTPAKFPIAYPRVSESF